MHLETMGDQLVAAPVDQGSRRCESAYQLEFADAIELACDAWDEVANLHPGFREP
jgi:hypothetical protein